MSQHGSWNTVTSDILEIWEDTLGEEKGAILCNLPSKNHPLMLIMANMSIYLNRKANLTWLIKK